MKIPQHFPREIDTIRPVTRPQIASEAVFRRGDPDFVARMGGPFAKRILEVAESLGMVRDTTRIMVQKTPIVRGAYPDVPQWHADCVPGVPAKLAEIIRQKIDGLICVLLDEEANPEESGTLFLDGELELDMDAESDADYKPGTHLSAESGDINWIHPQVAAQLGRTVRASNLKPNTVYRYSSDQFHIAPVMKGDSGQRIVVRLNTPPEDFAHSVPVNNTIIVPEPSYVFRVNDEHTKWRREHR